MPRQPSPTFAVLMMVMGVLSILATCVPAGFVYRALTSELAYSRDVEVRDLLHGDVDDGELVLLRDMRDRSAPQHLADGRVLYPSEPDPHVMVECDEDDCVGYLVGSVEELQLEGAPPAGWPVAAGERVRVVRVGVLGAEQRSHATLASIMAGALLLLGLACVGMGVLALSRRKTR